MVYMVQKLYFAKSLDEFISKVVWDEKNVGLYTKQKK